MRKFINDDRVEFIILQTARQMARIDYLKIDLFCSIPPIIDIVYDGTSRATPGPGPDLIDGAEARGSGVQVT
jgi:hypothetical protein